MREIYRNHSFIPAVSDRQHHHGRPKLCTHQGGTALTEATIVLPIFCLLVAGLLQFGYLFGILMNLRSAASVGARAAILGSGLTAVQVCDAARSSIANVVDTSLVSCQTSPSTLPTVANTPITVTLTYPAPTLSFYAAFNGSSSSTLRAETTMQ